MAEIDVSGTATGSGTLSTALILGHLVSGVAIGSGTPSVTPVQTLLFGSQFRGAGTLIQQTNVTASGTTTGSGSVSTTMIRLVGARSLPLVGRGTLFDIVPLPMIGQGFLTGYLDQETIPPIECCQCHRCHHGHQPCDSSGVFDPDEEVERCRND